MDAYGTIVVWAPYVFGALAVVGAIVGWWIVKWVYGRFIKWMDNDEVD